jgi:hypothetical protein
MTDLTTRLQQMLHEAGPRGITSDYLGDDVAQRVSTMPVQWRKAGKAFSCVMRDKNRGVRFFETEAWRDEYLRAKADERKPSFGRKKIPGGAKPIVFERNALVITPPHVKVQYIGHGGASLRTGTHASEE